MVENFEVVFLQEAKDFLDKLHPRTREKVFFNIRKVRINKNPRLLKKLNKDIWEFRTFHFGLQVRLFAFWDRDEKTQILVVATHGMIKKSGKTPQSDVIKAKKAMELYFRSKI